MFIGLMTPDGAIWFRYQRAGMTIYRKERSFRDRNVPFAKGTFFIRKEGFIQTFQAHWSKFGTERLKIFSHKSYIMYKKTFEAV